MIKLYHKTVENSDIFNYYISDDSYLRVDDILESDFCLYTDSIHAPGNEILLNELLRTISKEYRGKKIIVFVLSDYSDDVEYYGNLIIVRSALYKSKIRYNEMILPALWSCKLPFETPFDPINSDKISVGFCGLISTYREKLISLLEINEQIECDFIKRNSFWGGKPLDEIIIADFYENIKNNQVTVCQRGYGNFSWRFYETLSAGRIPLLVDTDIMLPFEDEINWSEYIIMGKTEEEAIENLIKEKDTLYDRQIKCGQLYKEYFSYNIFGKKLFSSIINKYTMKHFYQNIPGWFDFQEVYSNQVKIAKDDFHFVEIGAWLGTSTSFMAVEIINSGKKIKFDVIDTWEGSINELESTHKLATETNIFEIFKKNLSSVIDYINPIKMDSIEASKLYKDESLDFVFIDANHEYDFIRKDILTWLPKVKKGGYIGGHDYNWPSVTKAVDEIFYEDKNTIFTTWLNKKKTNLE